VLHGGCFDNLTDAHEMAAALTRERETLAERARTMGGVELMRAYSDLTDALISRIFEVAVGDGHPTPLQGDIAVAAVGGYGRREMSPFSDVDVAFLVRGDENDEIDSVAKRAFRTLMDVTDEAGLRVGYSYRRIDDVEHLPLDTQTAMLDARCIAGSETVAGAFQAGLHAGIVPVAFVKGHIDARKSPSGTPFAVEPDVKQGQGGLRDIHAARWIAQIAFGLANGDVWTGLRARGVLTDDEIGQMETAREFLSRTRNALHLIAGRALDILGAARHEEVAATLGFAHAQDCVSSYYQHTHLIARIFAKTVDAALESELGVEPGVVSRNGRLCILDRGLLQRDDSAAVRLFRYAQMFSLRFDRDTANLVAERGRNFQLTPDGAMYFLDILSSPGAAVALRQMVDLEFLRSIVLRFGDLMYLVPGDAAHAYTVGEHSLRALEEIEAVFEDPDPRLADVFSRIQNLEVLFLAVLLHDIGKLDGAADHAKSGAFQAARLARRLGMPEDAVQRVEFLVRHHLRMSETARLRDLGQQKTISDFVAVVNDQQLLDMLLLLSIADARSTGTTGWSEVQSRFLLELHERAMAALRSPDAPHPDIERHRSRVRRELCLANMPADEVDEHCASMPASYLLNTPSEVLCAHIGHIRTVRSGGAAVEITDEPGGQFTELTVVAMDRGGLLADIAGVLHALGVDVHAAQIYTRHAADDIAIDLLYIDFEGRQLAETKKWQVEGELTSILGGEATVADLLRRRGKGAFSRPETMTVRELVNASDHHTVLEIRASDTPGLLYYLTHRLSEHGVHIHSARIATWGHEALDAFYVSDSTGNRLPPERVAALAAAI